jgi:polyphosphate kinase 2 (PPK2 family)
VNQFLTDIPNFEKMLDRLQELKVKVFFADNWEACA